MNNNKFKIMILQFDTRSDNIAINAMLDLNKKYCEMHGYDYVFDNVKIDEQKYDFEDLMINDDTFKLRLYYHRFEMFERYFNDYDYLVSIDSDSCISNPLIKIENLIDDSHEIFLSQDTGIYACTIYPIYCSVAIQKYLKEHKLNYLNEPWKQMNEIDTGWKQSIRDAMDAIVSNIYGFNAGFIILKCSELMKQFISDCKKYYVLFETKIYDQGCIATLLRTKKYNKALKILPLTTMGNPLMQHPDFIYNEDKHFICHWYGPKINENDLLNKINFIEQNKWWSKINLKKIAILGSGQLGKELYESIKNLYNVKIFSHKKFDICNILELSNIINEFDIVINCVANINADKIEILEKENSFNVNYLAVKNLAEFCKHYNKKLIHISSDYVYGSNNYNDILSEDFECHPINQYGIDKLNAEKSIINEKLNDFLILRVAWLFGKYGKQNFIEKIKVNLNNNEIKVVDDQVGNVTSTKTVIEVIKKYLEDKLPSGIYNVQNNDEVVSRYDIACYIAKQLKSDCKIIPCKTSNYELPAKRQLNSNLDTTKIRKYIKLPKWKNEIYLYLNEFINNKK